MNDINVNKAVKKAIELCNNDLIDGDDIIIIGDQVQVSDMLKINAFKERIDVNRSFWPQSMEDTFASGENKLIFKLKDRDSGDYIDDAYCLITVDIADGKIDIDRLCFQIDNDEDEEMLCLDYFSYSF